VGRVGERRGSGAARRACLRALVQGQRHGAGVAHALLQPVARGRRVADGRGRACAGGRGRGLPCRRHGAGRCGRQRGRQGAQRPSSAALPVLMVHSTSSSWKCEKPCGPHSATGGRVRCSASHRAPLRAALALPARRQQGGVGACRTSAGRYSTRRGAAPRARCWAAAPWPGAAHRSRPRRTAARRR
jgi:hypothetical protein